MRVSLQRAEVLTSTVHGELLARAQLGALLREAGDRLQVPARASLAVRLTDDGELRDLNARFLGVDAPTDVLAFPADEPGRVGDIAISVERAAAQNPADPAAEIRLLAVHGLLHCLGHDHHGSEEARLMTAETRRLLPDQPVPDLVPGA